MFHSPKRLRGSGVGHGLLCSKSSAILGLVALGGVLMYLFQRHGLTTSSTATSRHSRLITVGGGNGEPGSHSCKNLCTEAGSGHFSSNTDTPCKWHGWFVHAHAVAPYKDKQFALMVRSYYRDAKQLEDSLLRYIGMFVDRSRVDVVIILDDENPLDHQVGECLESKEGLTSVHVRYENLSPQTLKMLEGVNGTSRAFPKRNAGYDRQQYSTFFFDKYTSAEYIGVLDSDGVIFSFLTKSTIFGPDGRIMIRALNSSSSYVNDPVALKFPADYDFMEANRFPMWFHRDTLGALRAYLAEQHGGSFDDAFASFFTAPYSQLNIMSAYALRYEPHWYSLITVSKAPAQVVSIGCNGELACPEQEDVRLGCCHVHGVLCESDTSTSSKSDGTKLVPQGKFDHLLRFYNLSIRAPDLQGSQGSQAAEAHMRDVHAALSALPKDTIEAMRQLCLGKRSPGQSCAVQKQQS